MRSRLLPAPAVAILLLAVVPSAASGADAVEPRDGDTVASRPTFAFDFVRGNAYVEVARNAEVKTAGDDIGAFVDPYASASFTIGGEYSDGPPFVMEPVYPERLAAGPYYWHVRADDYGDDGEGGGPAPAWSSTRRFTVRDEPPIFEGWTSQATKLKRAERGCGSTLRLRGRVVFTDNQRGTQEATLVLRVRSGGRTFRLREALSEYSTTYDVRVCTRGKALDVSPSVRDPGGQVARGERRVLRAR